MTAARRFHLLLLTTLAVLVIAAMATTAGSEDDPEVTDAANDATTGRDSHDLTKAWVEAEENDTVTFRMKLSELDAISPRDDWATLPTSIYEYYFTLKDKNYAARASIPVHGPLAAFAGFSLHEVTYGATGNMSFEGDEQISGRYLYNNGILEFTVDKADMGSPSQGDLVTHMWAAVYFRPRGENREVVDEAMTFSAAGRQYVIRGQYSQLYDVRLKATNTTIVGRPREVATFNVTIVSQSTTDVEINITNKSIPEGYFLNFSRNMPIAVPQESSVSFMLMITVPDEALNGTDVMVVIWGEYETEEGVEERTDDLNLLLQIRFIPPKPPVKEESIFDMIVGFISDWWWLITIICVVGIVAGLVWYFRDYQKKRAMDEYLAYLEAQGQQREAGEV
jgi:hypothetical protein